MRGFWRRMKGPSLMVVALFVGFLHVLSETRAAPVRAGDSKGEFDAPMPVQDPANSPACTKPQRTDLPADNAIWGYGSIGGPYPAGGPPPAPEPIVPLEWLVVPSSAGDGLAALARCVVDPGLRLPSAGLEIPGIAGSIAHWEARQGQPVRDASCAYTRVVCEHDEVRMARLSGAGLLLVNGAAYVGDVEGRGYRGVPVQLKQGANGLFVFDIRADFELELWAPQSRIVIGTWDVLWPDASDLGAEVSYPLINVSSEPVGALHLHYGHAVDPDPPSLTDWQDNGWIPPLGLLLKQTPYSSIAGPLAPPANEAATVPVCAYSGEDTNADRQLLRRDASIPGKHAVSRDHSKRGADALAGTPCSRLGVAPTLVAGTYGARSASADHAAQARFDQWELWYRMRTFPLVCPDKDQPCSAVLYGNADTNLCWSLSVPDDFPIQVHAGSLRVEGREFRGDDLCGWFCFKTKAGNSIVAIADTGARGARLNLILHPLTRPSRDLDYSFHRADGLEHGALALVAEGKLAR